MTKFKLSDFENNEPRETEVLRTKVYFKYYEPTFAIDNFPNEITFGVHQSKTQFAIYKSHKDYINEENPCISMNSINYFSNTKFVGAVFILETCVIVFLWQYSDNNCIKYHITGRL
uniref:Uncharacterized protein n=1 Tax=Megaselia scalaris TaxID=36166 RepID=T1GGH1_MEGSC